jgi:hypothetical protein
MPSTIKFETGALGDILENRKNLATPINRVPTLGSRSMFKTF